ncbi:MAG: fructosamine kinase family protein [Woeseiaceae bacterium]|nr:fructosamine kinase family protein [Woeseiaceae bacterium]
MRTSPAIDDLLASLDLGGLIGLTPVGGGDISAAWRVECERGTVFAKTGPASSESIFGSEAAGLQELAKADCIRVPAVVSLGCSGDEAWIALEWLDMQSSSPAVDARLGEQLAALHRYTADQHGFYRDTMIGSTPQPNAQNDNWVEFYQLERLEYQLRTARANGFGGELQTLGSRVIDSVPVFFSGREPQPSLLHGDLWSGNKAACNGEPIIFDPAVYYGDRETDLAMSRLFGGFHRSFYEAYESAWPLPDGHQQRLALYQLYHVLNHLNIFGGGYLGRSISLMRSLLD